MKIDAKDPVVIIKVECFGEKGSRILDLIFDTGSTYTGCTPDITFGSGENEGL